MIPKEWNYTTIGELGSIRSGSTPPRSNEERYFTGGVHWWVKTMDLNNGIITSTDEKITDLAIKETSCPLLPPGTVLVAMYGGFNQIGRTGVLQIESSINQAISGIIPNKATCTSDYLLYWLNANVGLWKRFAASSRKDPNITRKDVEEFLVLLPPLPEQRAIAAILSTWDEAIMLTEQLIAALKRRKQALMQLLLTGEVRFPGFEGEEWEEHILAELASVIMGQSPDSENYNTEGEGVPLIQGNADIRNRKSAPRAFTTQITKRCQIGDVLLSVRAPVGETAISVHEACIGRGMSAIRATNSDPRFLYQLMVGQESRWDKYAQGSTFTAINSDDIKNLELIISPNKYEQQKIADLFDLCDSEIELLNVTRSNFHAEKRGLMQQLLTGAIRVQVEE